MKALRELGIVILSFVLVSAITFLGILISFKDIVTTSFVPELAKNIIISENVKEEDKDKVNEAIDKISSYKGTQEVIDSVLNDISKSENGEIKISDETLDKFIKAIKDNKEEFIKLGASEADIDQLITEVKDQKNREEINKSINEGYKEAAKDSNVSSLDIIKTYAEISSPTTIIKIGVFIAVIVALIALLSWSPYKWIRPTSISTIIAGINLLIVYAGIDTILKMVNDETSATLNVNTSVLKTTAFSVFFGGIAALAIYIFINIMAKKNKIDVEPDKAPVTETPVTEQSFSKFCASCGKGVGVEDKVCSNCGAPLD